MGGGGGTRNNEEIDLLIKPADMIRCIQEQRVRRIGKIVRMDKERMVEVRKEWSPTGRQRLRWGVGVRGVVGRMKIGNWSKVAMDKEAWKRIVE
jgi:hypothetical protein